MKSIKRLMKLPGLAILVAVSSLTIAQSSDIRHGEFQTKNDQILVWHSDKSEWLTPRDFWLAFAEERGGLTWGIRSTYPNYDDVNEYDTMIIQIEKGECLMEFYHSRWRRANDVRRWNMQFNEIEGCPYVFD